MQSGPQTTTQSQMRAWKGIKTSGIVQLVLGILTIVLGVVAVVGRTFSVYGAPPFWCGLLLYVVAGILGIISWYTKDKGVAIGYMVMSIFACLGSWVVIWFAASSLLASETCGQGHYCKNDQKNGLGTINTVLIVLGVFECLGSIGGSIMTYSAVCSAQTVMHDQHQSQITGQPQDTVYYIASAPQPQYSYIPQQGGVLAPQGQYEVPPPSEAALRTEHGYQTTIIPPTAEGVLAPQGQYEVSPPSQAALPTEHGYQTTINVL